MRKVILLAAVAIMAASAANAQEFQKGDWAVNVGISLENTDPMFFGGSVEYGLVDNVFGANGLTFGLGAELSLASKHSFNFSVIGVRAPFHYSPAAKLDLYSAPALLVARVSGDGHSNSDTDFGWTFIGARYLFAPNLGVFCELGSNNALEIAAGLSFKF